MLISINKCFSQENITELFDLIKNTVLNQVKLNISGEEKKMKLDKIVIEFINKKFVSNNVVVSLVINILTDLVPRITQAVYDVMLKKLCEK